MSYKIEVPIDKKKIALLLVAALVFVALGTWLIYNPDRFTNNGLKFRVSSPVFVQIVGILGVLFFGAAGVYGVIKLLDKRMGLVMNSIGVTDNSNASSIGLIEWNDIQEIRTEQVTSTRFLLIDVHNPEKYIGRAKGLQKVFMKANLNQYVTPISIASSTLRCDFEELEELIIAEYRKNKS